MLVAALRALERSRSTATRAHEKERLAMRYAELVYFGQWFSPLREGLDAFVEAVAEPVTGAVTLKLYKRSGVVCARSSPHSLYDQGLASFDMTGYSAQDSAGFIRLFGLPHRGRRRLAPRRSTIRHGVREIVEATDGKTSGAAAS